MGWSQQNANEFPDVSTTSVPVTAGPSVVRIMGFHLTKTHIEGGKYVADKLIFSNCLRAVYCSNFDLEHSYRQLCRLCLVSLKGYSSQ